MALDFLAGCFGGIAGVVVGHPLDTIKVNLQTQDPKNPRYRSTWQCFKCIVEKESARGLYRGMTSPLAGVAGINAIIFGVYGNVLRRLPDDWNPMLNVFMAGATSGLLQSVVASPIELAKSRVQLTTDDVRRRPVGNVFTVLSAVHRSEGWRRGVFRGCTVTAMRDAPSFGLYFATYEVVCAHLAPFDATVPGSFVVILAGGIGGIASWILTYPLDVVKTRVQTDASGSSHRYKGAAHCFVHSYRQEGWRCFTRGMSSTILRAFPTNAATFLAVSLTFRLLGHRLDSTATSSSSSSIKDITVDDAVAKSFKWPSTPIGLQQSMTEDISEWGWLAAHANYW